jgi:8-oxo-dGTP pyrophosphatase MutT (NUDIX family)
VNRTASEGEGHQIAAAGGVLVRADQGGGPRIAVIHRPKYLDWSFPKGKLEAGEGWLEAALREVEEETGARARPIRELPPVRYRDARGRPKLVRYWLMEPLEGDFSPDDEVDQILWLPEAEASELLTYPHDRELLREALRGGE